MVKLTEEEKSIYERKRNLIYRRLPLIRKVSLPIRMYIDSGLMTLVKNKSAEFISEMYIDFVEREITLNEDYGYDEPYSKLQIYRNNFIFKNEEMFSERMSEFCSYLMSTFEKTDDGYVQFVDDGHGWILDPKDYYNKNGNIIDNNRILELMSLIKEKKGPYKHGVDYYTHVVALKKLMSYILMNDELLINRDSYYKIIEYLENNYTYFYDCFKMNTEKYYEASEVNIYFFDPKEFVKKYNYGLNKKTIE